MRVMVIGASGNRAKHGNKAVRAYLRQGHDVVPINPNENEVEGIRTYANVRDPKGPFDRAAIYVPPSVGVGIMADLAARGDVGEIWLNPGADGPEVIAEAERLGLNIVQACAIVDIGERP